MTTQHFLQKSELPILDFRKTLLLYVANTGNSDPFLTSRINVETGLKPGPLSLQHLLGPRHCRYFRPVTDRRVTRTDQHCSVNKLAPKNDLWCELYIYPTRLLPSATLAWCCPLIQSRWPTARWGSRRNLRSLLCVRRGWTKENQSRRDYHDAWNSIKAEKNSTLHIFVPADQQLRRAVLSVLWWLLLSDLAEVPHIEASVSAAGGQDGFIMRRPLNLLGRNVPHAIISSQTLNKPTLTVTKLLWLFVWLQFCSSELN